jgi:Flp pilus assembly protein TadG
MKVMERTMRRWTKIVRAKQHGEEGSALAEMALILPVLLLLLTGIFSFSIAINNYLTLTEAVNVGGRTLAISRGNTLDPCATAVSAVEGAAPNLKAANLTFTYSLNGVAFSGLTCSSTSSSTGAAGDLVQGKNAEVIVTYPCSLSVYGHNYAPTCLLKSEVTELVQ